jgi:tight adherence protein C
MHEVPVIVLLIAGIGVFAAAAWGLRGLLEIREALLLAEFDRLVSPPNWPATRALVGVLTAMPALLALALVSEVQAGTLVVVIAPMLVAMGFWAAPRLLLAARRRVERQMLDELSLHLDLLALAMESGNAWSKALGLCRERAPAGPLQRAWERVILEIHAGVEPLDALRNLEQRTRLRPLATLVSALRAADKLQLPVAPVLRERARQAAACRFARAEQAARVAPLKLWAAMLLCLAPCTAVVLAFPLAQGLEWLLR